MSTQLSGCRNNPDLKMRGIRNTTVRAESTGDNNVFDPSTLHGSLRPHFGSPGKAGLWCNSDGPSVPM